VAPDSPFPRTATRTKTALLLAVVAALAAVLAAGVQPLVRGGRTADARWTRISGDVSKRMNAAFAATGDVAGALARRGDVARALSQSTEGPPELFRIVEDVPERGDALSITIFDTSGGARAWHGRPSELSGVATVSPSGTAASASALGFRVVRFEPILVPSPEAPDARRVGTVVVEQVISERREGGLVSDAFRVETPFGAATLRPLPSAAARADEALSFIIRSPDGEALVIASSTRERLEREIAADTAKASGALLAVLAVLLVLATGPLLDRVARARDWRRVAAYASGAVALWLLARGLLWVALPAWKLNWAPSSVNGAVVLFLRSPVDLLLSAMLCLAIGGILASLAGRSRVAFRRGRRWPRRSTLAFASLQFVAAGAATAVLLVADRLLSRSVPLTGIEALNLSVNAWAGERWLSLLGLLLVETAAIWIATSLLVFALAGWRVPRRSVGMLVPVSIWLAAAAVLTWWSRPSAAAPSASFYLALVLALGAGVFTPRVTTRFRRGGASARLLSAALALLIPALIAYPALLGASEQAMRSIIETRYSRQTVSHRQDLQNLLQTTLKQVDAMPGLRDMLRSDPRGASTERAFAVWSQTPLAEARLTSSLELYAADGTLVSRFALNFPEYEATAQITRSERCEWQVVGEARPFGAEERAALHAERAVCSTGPAGRVTDGSIVVHVMLDYNALPFISPESPYREVFRADAPASETTSRRPIALVIYGWSLLPVYTSGVQVWPIGDEVFARIYASRAGFWTDVFSRNQRWHVYFVNDRAGIYALGYPALEPFDHLVHLAELLTLAAVAYVVGLAALAVFARVARSRVVTGRALLRDVRASFYRKLLIAFVAASVIPVLALALVIRTYFATRLRADVNAEAARTATVAQHALEELAALLRLAGLSAPPINDDLMVEVSQMIGRDVNVFEGATLLATSQRDLFASGLLPTRTPEEVYRQIVLQRQPTYVTEDEVGSLRYLVAAAPVGATGRDAIVTVPLASRQAEIEREIDELDRGLLLVVLLCIAVGAAIGLPTAERIADPVRRLTRASRRIAGGDFDTRVAIRSIDELRRLVDAFNQMAAELKTQRQQLERTHRLEAWAEMARQVAHDIKNPLTPIQLSAEHLRRVHADKGGPLSPILDSCVDSILTQVHLLRQIAGEFSAFASSPTARPAPLNVPALVDEVVGPYRTGLEGRIQITVEAPPALPDAMADRALIFRALTNIIENALHAMPGQGELTIVASEEPGQVAIAVTDSGVGMDEEALARVFEPYFSTKATGTGLGLTIASRNVELNGGTVSVTSRKGEGTTVTIRLPRA
jgi:signal transduction histidine kinase